MRETTEKKPRMKRETRNDLIRLAAVTLVTILLMFVLPYIFVSVVNGLEGMQMFMVLYFWGYPIYAAVVGIYAAWRFRRRWYLPVVLPVIYLLSSALLYESMDISFFQSAGLYLLFSYMTAGLGVMLFSFRRREY